MPELFLAVSVVGALFTLNAFRPHRRELSSVPAFFAGWLTSELPAHHLAWQAVATIVFVRAGALDEWQGWAGLALTAVSWAGLLALIVQAQRAATVMEDALVEALGPNYREAIDADLMDDPSGTPGQWRRLLVPFVMRDPRVEKVRNLVYHQEGRLKLRLDILRSKEHRHGRPVFVYVHGGAWVIGDKREQGLPLLLQLAARDWVCVTINYRLSPRATFPDHIVDVKRALAWVKANIERYGGDPRFVVIGGGSAGGHLSALAALTPDDADFQPGFEAADTSVQACVPFYGVYDLVNREGVGQKGMERFLARTVMKSRLADDRHRWEKASPMSRVRTEAPPFFVVHGANDTLVPVAQARLFVQLLREASDAPVAYAEMPGAQHAFEVFRSIRTFHAITGVERFLAWTWCEWQRAAEHEAEPGRTA